MPEPPDFVDEVIRERTARNALFSDLIDVAIHRRHPPTILRCTRKLLGLLEPTAPLAEAPPSDDDWYGNLLWFDRRKCLLLTHAGTLFSAFRADVRKADLRPPGRYLLTAVEEELRDEELPPDTFGRPDADHVGLARTASRSVLGFMNEMAVHIRYQVDDAGGIEHCDPRVINRRLRRTLLNRDGYAESLDLVARWIESRGTA